MPGEVIRFVFMGTHYRKPMDWTAEKVREAEATLRKWATLIENSDAQSGPPLQVLHALEDDLNTPLAIKEMHKLAKDGNAVALRSALEFVGLGTISKESLTMLVEEMVDGAFDVGKFIEEMRTARENRNWAESDRIRDALVEAGVEIKITPEGIEHSITSRFDPTKLEALE